MSTGWASTTGRTMRFRRRPLRWPPLRRGRRASGLLGGDGVASDDPVRVYQNFATLDLLSNGRAEIMVGRGSFIESYPLFGYDLNDYDVLFSEKLDLLLKLREQEHVTWSGAIRAPLDNAGIYPRRATEPDAGVGGGGRHAAVGGAGRHIGTAHGAGHHWRRARALCPMRIVSPVSASGPGTGICRSASTCMASWPMMRRRREDTFFPGYAEVMTRIGRERGWPPRRGRSLRRRAGRTGI